MLPILTCLALAAQDPATDAIYAELQKYDRVNPVVLVAQAVTPAVVYIQTEVMQVVNTWVGRRLSPRSGAGSGVVVRPEGFVVTNYHVVRGAQRIQVSFADDPSPWPAEVVSYVEREDLALLRIVPRSETVQTELKPLASARLSPPPRLPEGSTPTFPTAHIGTSSDLMPGEQVIAIGNPYGQSHTVSTGIISGLHRDVPISSEGLYFSDLIQTDASINFGNSGGPLLNVRGEVIGINSAMNIQAENIGFAIPIDRVVEVLNDYLYPQARTSWLGFELADDEVVRVGRVWPDGPAELAGLCEGDRVLKIGSTELAKTDDWLVATVGLPADAPVEVEFLRGGRRAVASLRPWDKVDGLIFERLGMTLNEVAIQTNRWLVVAELAKGGPAERTGLQTGDLIAAIQVEGDHPRIVRNKLSFAGILQQLKRETPLEVEVYRDDDGNRNYARDERYTGRIVTR